MKILPFIILLIFCQKSPDPGTIQPYGFEKAPQVISIKRGIIPEASGIADSKKNAGYLWVQQDSGNPPYVYLLKHDGTITDSVFIDGATNKDWEDMALVGDELYIGDIGDNNAAHSKSTFYCFKEPALGTHKVTSFKVINFKYPDGAHDAEAFLVDPGTKDIYIITKREEKSKVYKLVYPQSTTSLNEAVFVTNLTFNGVVSAAISSNAREIIIKTYASLFYYTKEASQSIAAALEKQPSTLDYQVELQGEAIGFRLDNKGFYTLSEKAFNVTPALHYYKRK